MPLRSMTGFARSDGSADGIRFHWELRSVNGRGLDIRMRLPQGYEALEPAVRDLSARSLTRGNVTATLSLETGTGAAEVRINERALAVVVAAAEQLATRAGFERPRPEGVLGLRGVIEMGEAASGPSDAVREVLLGSLAAALEELVAARRMEGERIEQVLRAHVDAIEGLVMRIAELPIRQPEALRVRLAEQVQRLLATGAPLDPDRLHQEAVLIATRGDVEEELKRLGAHIAAARTLFADTAASGRRLDFLAQEFNREANTICSKSSDIEMTRLGLELKAVIDQLREQVQNIE